MSETHYVYPDAIPGQPRRGRAYCGRLVHFDHHSNRPTCAICAAHVDEDDATTVDDRFGPETSTGVDHD